MKPIIIAFLCLFLLCSSVPHSYEIVAFVPPQIDVVIYPLHIKIYGNILNGYFVLYENIYYEVDRFLILNNHGGYLTIGVY